MNWAFKIATKIALSRLPLSYDWFRWLGIFRHGSMNKSDYAQSVFFRHMERVGGAEAFSGKTCLELGPGDSLASAILAHAMGATKIYLVDVGNFVEADAGLYHEIVDDLERRGFPVSDLKGVSGVDDLLERTGAIYLTDGLASLRTIPSNSVDVIWSHAVLEHIRVHEVTDVLSEMRRIMSTSGIMSHRIDYKDHLGGSLNNLRFSSKFWEAESIARSGFYTNRIRNSEFLDLIERAGFSFKTVEPVLWDKIPISRGKMAKQFRSLSDEDLRTKNVDVIAITSS